MLAFGVGYLSQPLQRTLFAQGIVELSRDVQGPSEAFACIDVPAQFQVGGAEL